MNRVIQVDLMDICYHLGAIPKTEKSSAPGADAVDTPFPPEPEENAFSVGSVTRNISTGDEDAFNMFYDQYAHRIYGYLLSVSHGDEHLTRDSMQETMMRVIRYIKPHTDENAFWRWLKRLSRTALYDLIRKRSSYSKHMAILKEETGINHDHGHDVHDARWAAALEQALSAISEDDRKLVEGFYFDEHSHSTLAAQHHITRKAVESKLARARKKLRTMLTKALNDER